MASLQARHLRSCSAFPGRWTPAERTSAGSGCTCEPTFYLAIRHGPKLVRERAGKSRHFAERLRDMRNAEVDGEALQPLSGVHFAEWGAQWLSQLERRKSTVDSYRSTIAYASDAFGDVWMRNVGPTDVAHLSHGLKRRGLSEATTAKHL